MADHVLLSDEALDVAVGERLLEGLGEGGVLGVSIQGHDSLAGPAQLGESDAVRLPGGDLPSRDRTFRTKTFQEWVGQQSRRQLQPSVQSETL